MEHVVVTSVNKVVLKYIFVHMSVFIWSSDISTRERTAITLIGLFRAKAQWAGFLEISNETSERIKFQLFLDWLKKKNCIKKKNQQ